MKLDGEAGCAVDLALHPSDPVVASAGRDGAVRLWNLDDGTPHSSWRTHSKATYAVTFDAAGTHVVSAGKDGLVVLRRVADGAEVARHTVADKALYSVAWHPTEPLVAVSGPGGTLLVLRLDGPAAE